jgi:hypothetical protein
MMTEIQKQLIELRPGESARIAGRWVAGTYRGWLISDCQADCEACAQTTQILTSYASLPEAAAELEGKTPTDVAA